MRTRRVAVVYNEPLPSRYDAAGEAEAVAGVLRAVGAVKEALAALGNEATPVPLRPERPLREALAALRADCVFNLFEGFSEDPATEALVPEYLAERGIPFTGCPAAALRLCLDKAGVKAALQAAGIPTPDFQLLNPQTLPLFQLNYPCIVKPHREDASHGITAESLVTDAGALERQVRRVSRSYGGSALVEEFAGGREFNATVLGGDAQVLPVSEIVYRLPPEMPPILTFAAKWAPESAEYRGTRAVCPAPVGKEEREEIAATARAAFRRLIGRGYARVDMRRDGGGRLNVIEVNPNPDISPDAGAARQAAAAGMDYAQFVDRLRGLALEK